MNRGIWTSGRKRTSNKERRLEYNTGTDIRSGELATTQPDGRVAATAGLGGRSHRRNRVVRVRTELINASPEGPSCLRRKLLSVRSLIVFQTFRKCSRVR